MHRLPLALTLAVLVATGGCSTVYYAAMSQLGWAKADLLANRVQLARDAMDQARIQFADALPQFAAARTQSGGNRAARQQALSASYADSTASAALVTKRRSAVEKAADVLFGEWQREISDAADGGQRAKRQQRYDAFRPPYDRLLDAMRSAEASLPPVLEAMNAELAALAAAATSTPPAGVDPAAGDRLIRNLQLAVALADQYVAELENTD
jgi:DUF2959 family protein